MGHKVHPKSFRLGKITTWDSKWFSLVNYKKFLKQDIQIRKFLRDKLKDAGIAKIEIERTAGNITVLIHSSRPGVIIGRRGTKSEEIKKELEKKFINKKTTLNLNIQEVKKPSLSAEIVGQNVIQDIERRIRYRRVMRQVVDQVMKAGAQGVKVMMAGRLDGVEIARKETLAQGKVPLHTIRADIDYASGVAKTIYGTVGVKIWIYKGEVFEKEGTQEKERRDG